MASDVLVSARISKGKKDAARKILSSLGFTTSDLINSAFDYVLKHQELPDQKNTEPPLSTRVPCICGRINAPDRMGCSNERRGLSFDASKGQTRSL